jgi:hypothetical protein
MIKLALSYAASTQHMPYIIKSLQLSAVKAGETVLIHTDTESAPHYPPALLGAARILDADGYLLVHPADTPEKGVIMERGKMRRIRSEAGTDLTIYKGRRYTFKIWGGSDIPVAGTSGRAAWSTVRQKRTRLRTPWL